MLSMSLRACAGALILCLACLVMGATAAEYELQTKLVVPAPSYGDQLGRAVSLEGDLLLAGYPQAGADRAVFCYQRSGSSWTQTASLRASDAASYDLFGEFVSLNGANALIGAYGDDDRGSLAGASYIFSRTGSTWSQVSKLKASDGAAGDRFGSAVALDGDYALIGAQNDDDMGTDSGSAYVVARNGAAWAQQAKLTASDGTANDRFGSAVAISGEYAVVGSSMHGSGNFPSGAAYVFRRSGTSWAQVAELCAADGANLGTAVSLCGSRLLVGALDAAYIFERQGESWTRMARLTASDAATWDYFGRSVCLQGDYAVIGAEEKDAQRGAAYVFHLEEGLWIQIAKLTAPDGAVGDLFGRSVAIDASGTAAVGAFLHDAAGVGESGAVYIFVPEPATAGLVILGMLAVAGNRRRGGRPGQSS